MIAKLICLDNFSLILNHSEGAKGPLYIHVPTPLIRVFIIFASIALASSHEMQPCELVRQLHLSLPMTKPRVCSQSAPIFSSNVKVNFRRI